MEVAVPDVGEQEFSDEDRRLAISDVSVGIGRAMAINALTDAEASKIMVVLTKAYTRTWPQDEAEAEGEAEGE